MNRFQRRKEMVAHGYPYVTSTLSAWREPAVLWIWAGSILLGKKHGYRVAIIDGEQLDYAQESFCTKYMTANDRE